MHTKLNIAICDDESDSRQKLNNMLQKVCRVKNTDLNISMFSSGQALVDSLGEYNGFDCVFLDVLMDKLNGIGVAKKLRDADYANMIIFVSNTAYYALKGYEVNAYGYYLKPMTETTLVSIMDNVIEKFRRKWLVLPTKSTTHRISTDTIQYIECMGRVIKIVTDTEDYQAYAALYELEDQLDSRYFMRCHKGFIINLKKIVRISGQSIYLCGKKEIPLGRKYKCQVHGRFLDFLRIR